MAYFKFDRLKDAQTMVEAALSIQPNYSPAQKLLKEIKDARNWLKLGGKQVRRLVSRIAKTYRVLRKTLGLTHAALL